MKVSDSMIRVSQIKISIDDSIEKVKELVLKQLNLREEELLEYRIYKQSIDARRRGKLDFVYTVDIAVKDEAKILAKKLPNVSVTPDIPFLLKLKQKTSQRDQTQQQLDDVS